jgi:membrane-anchored protein YejM (alkaline phosphatase superfamily)
MSRCVLQNEPRGVLGSILGMFFGASWEFIWEYKSSRLGVYNRVQSWVHCRAYLEVCNTVYVPFVLNAVWCVVSSG